MLGTRAGLIEAALGRISPETIIRNIRLVNVYSGEILEGQEVALWQGRIAFVGPGAPMAGPDTLVIDGQGMYLLPGFLDVHAHVDHLINPLSAAKRILPTGTTGMLTDTHDFCAALGAKGLELLLEVTADIPFRYYFSAPAANPPLPEFEGEDFFTKDMVAAFLSHDRVLAVSEVTSWGRLMTPEQDFVEKLVMAKELGKRIEGHMAGCSYEKMNALVACGFTSCHESITAEQALQRLRLGLHVILRHGSVRADMEPLARMITDNPGLDTGRVLLSPDWFNPQDVLKHGYMNYLVAEAVKYGIPPVKAIQMVTINAAAYLGLTDEIGGIAPGRQADLLLVKDLQEPFPDLVLIGGKTVAQQGRLLAVFPDFPEVSQLEWRPGRKPDRPARADDFEIISESAHPEIPCMHMINKTITKVMVKPLQVCDGRIDISSDPELLKVSIWSESNRGWVTAVLSGFGAKVGAIASTICHETHNALVVGRCDRDMAMAVNRMLEIGGGIVVVQEGRIICELPLTVGGMISTASFEDVARGYCEINDYLWETGCPWDDPILSLSFLSFSGLPYVRITPKGIVDVLKKEIIFPNNSGGV